MQLGSRWSGGAAAPRGLSDALLAEIARVEEGLPADTMLRWTLTWLEGRPVVELDDGTVLRG
ncbi:MAG TPA: hypothetical protein PK890_06200 [Terrimesophilobacter sp.]|nr:hypothetical protein [Terrimesophilobacter sp.]